MFPFYELAVRYDLPVGIHTGGAGPDHGSPNFQWELGDPTLVKPILEAFPSVRLWIMHSGDQYFMQTIQLMKQYSTLYSDISVVANPDIVEKVRIYTTLKAFFDAGLEDRLMFATDNGDIQKMVATVMDLDFLTVSQKQKLFYKNAETFFGRKDDM
jgi:predicted TIM-barrel fold metal-dependent hydrolase